jgi:outer membrane receptor protein involved in Fe transport
VKLGIRGVSNTIGNDYGLLGDGNSTVGLYVNDVPIQGTGTLPDLALFDLQRVEVLKGPQGTLYGEGSMGGAVKMILNRPDTAAYSARAEASFGSISDGGNTYGVKGAVNLPLGERVAARVVASYDDNGGFIDNSLTGRKDVNSSTNLSLRGLLDWQITDAFDAEVLVMHQKFEQDDFDEFVVRTGVPALSVDFPDDRFGKRQFDLYGLTLRYDFGATELISSSSYWKTSMSQYDRARGIGIVFSFDLLDFGVPTTVAASEAQGSSFDIDQDSFTQELRFSSKGDERLDWTIGAYYRDLHQNGYSWDTIPGIARINTAITNAMLPSVFNFASPRIFQLAIDEKFRQTAVFGEVDYEIVDGLNLKAGLRWFDEDLSLRQANSGGGFYNLIFPTPFVVQGKAKDSDTIGRVGLSYKISDEHMVYGLVSQGFRSGGVNGNPANITVPVPSLFKSDSLVNYELGAKTAWLDGRLLANVALFKIDWKDVQGSVSLPPAASYKANSGDAEIKGYELQLIAAPTNDVQVGLNIAKQKSELTKLAAGAQARLGAPLPNAPDLTASAFVQVGWPVGNLGKGYARLDYQYVDDQAYLTLPRTGATDVYFLPSYNTGRAQLGLENERWAGYLYVDNLSDARALTSRQRVTGFNPDDRRSVIQPRTIGVRFSTSF